MVKWWDLDNQHCFKTMVGHRTEVRAGPGLQRSEAKQKANDGFSPGFSWLFLLLILTCVLS